MELGRSLKELVGSLKELERSERVRKALEAGERAPEAVGWGGTEIKNTLVPLPKEALEMAGGNYGEVVRCATIVKLFLTIPLDLANSGWALL